MTERGRWIAVATMSFVCITLAAGCGGRSHTIVTDVPTASDEARTTLYRAADARGGELRAHALEALASTVGAEAGEVFVKALDADGEAVQFVAAMAIGDVAYAPAAAKLGQMAAAADTDPSVQTAAIYALYRLGNSEHMSRLGKLLYDQSPQVRANAALVIGKLGMAAGVRPLSSRLGMEQDAAVRLQLAESLALLGDKTSYGLLSYFARVGEPHERVVAVQALGRTQSLRGKGIVLFAIGSRQPPPLRLMAAAALAQMGDYHGYDLAIEAVEEPRKFTQRSYDKPMKVSDPQIQQMQSLGAMALAYMNRPDAVDSLVGLLGSPNPTVRVSAARSILVLLKQYAGESAPSASEKNVAATGDSARQSDPPVLRTAPLKD